MGSLSPPIVTTSTSTPFQLRHLCRNNTLTSPTAGLCPGAIQANLLILPAKYAADFLLLCERNPVPCPLLGYSSIPGNPQTFTSVRGMPELISPITGKSNSAGSDFDIRTDLPAYNIYRDGKLVGTKKDVVDEWKTGNGTEVEGDGHVAFLIGCSFTFESALITSSLPPRHITAQTNVPMYRTTLPLAPAGIFKHGTWVVSMRPYHYSQVPAVRDITRPYRHMHGEPVAWGWDAVQKLGIVDLDSPEWGDRVVVDRAAGEVPVFWGCGVTPQNVVLGMGMAAEGEEKIEGTVMAHVPGCMLVLDLGVEEYLGQR